MTVVTTAFDIVVNGREIQVDHRVLTFAEIAALAFGPNDAGPFICYTITYRRGQGNKPAGTLVDGETVRIKRGMIFNVVRTDKS